MARWEDFIAEAPKLAAVAERLWPGIAALERGVPGPPGGTWFSISYLATVRSDGSPRLHPFCPILAGGRLFAAIPRSSPKGHDLRRDPRCAIHAQPGPDDDELCIRAVAREVGSDPDLRKLVADVVRPSGVGGMIASTTNDPLFEFDLLQVDVAKWLDIGQAGTHAIRRRWRARA